MLARALVCLPLVLAAPPASAEDFRIHSRVYSGEEPEPTSENTTLFHAGAVYDFLEKPAEVVIYDPRRGERSGRFVLLDPQRRVQTEIPLAEVQQFVERVAIWAAGKNDKLLNFLSQPKFAETLDSESNCWTYTSDWMVYRVKGRPAALAGAFAQYDDFSDWLVRLNVMLTIRQRAPYGLARLPINAALRKRKEIPEQVVLTIDSRRAFGKDILLRSEHRLTPMLSTADHERIDEANALLKTLRKVAFEEYLKRRDGELVESEP